MHPTIMYTVSPRLLDWLSLLTLWGYARWKVTLKVEPAWYVVTAPLGSSAKTNRGQSAVILLWYGHKTILTSNNLQASYQVAFLLHKACRAWRVDPTRPSTPCEGRQTAKEGALLTWHSAGTSSPHVVQEIVVGESSRREGETDMRMSSVGENRHQQRGNRGLHFHVLWRSEWVNAAANRSMVRAEFSGFLYCISVHLSSARHDSTRHNIKYALHSLQTSNIAGGIVTCCNILHQKRGGARILDALALCTPYAFAHAQEYYNNDRYNLPQDASLDDF